ncbi:carboxymuconolactone decarboxylase family protein [Amycolatopsis pithecellobii]|uniref:Carboxymuconolactone decarboxylase family protein n=1 Tax=Amycolatopsis pithecellobii TaxID=664692 RepID=A0A6N7YMJ6_9PSEU|nr:carboxymuconolactone decarboxylase family protein [Amycolatopsis pithecellobii]MTD53242.1 carboxymuconolactone decarboxylase family protein [Amycolatopsis pithecellobii]
MTTDCTPGDGDVAWGGRLPLVRSGPMDAGQSAWERELRAVVVPWAQPSGMAVTTAEGDLIGPFNAFVHRPRPGRAFMAWVLDDQAGSSLTPVLREIAILTVATAWNSGYEIYAHTAVARHVGVAEEVITSIISGTTTDRLSAVEAVVHRFTDELVREHSVSTGTYDRAIQAVGRHGVLDLVNVIGIYLATAALLNAFEVPAPRQE